jgi:hypothetical protein
MIFEFSHGDVGDGQERPNCIREYTKKCGNSFAEKHRESSGTFIPASAAGIVSISGKASIVESFFECNRVLAVRLKSNP